MNIGIVGAGYVGTCLGIALASRGISVNIYDIDEEKMKMLKYYQVPFKELQAQAYLDFKHTQKNFNPCSLNDLTNQSDIIFICVGTPSNPDGSMNTSYLESAIKSLAISLEEAWRKPTIVIKSTVVPGTTHKLKKLFEEHYIIEGNLIRFCMCPEFMTEGNAMSNILHPDKVVIGADTSYASQEVFNLYRILEIPREKIFDCNIINAEIIKYAQNAFLATKISFINIFAKLCELHKDADINVIADAIGRDGRISNQFLRAGVGYGGSCFTKDISAIREEMTYHYGDLLDVVDFFNKSLPIDIVFDIAMHIDWKPGETGITNKIKNKRVAVLGAAFKPNTDDMRDAPSTRIVENLLAYGAKVAVYDPWAMTNCKKEWENLELNGSTIDYCHSVEEALDGAIWAIVVTEWKEFRNLKPEIFVARMEIPRVYDARRIYDPTKMIKAGVMYYGVGYGNR